MKETLVILAAGMGSRYGGLKQIDTIGSNGESIIDFTIYDAIEAGFKKLVLIIKEEHKDLFEDHLVKKIRPFIEVEYAFQNINDLPDNISVPEGRVKPWGTTHALLSCRNILKDDPFIVCNADDYYGKDAFKKVIDFFHSEVSDSNFCMVGYKVKNTLSDHGTVTRGVCKEDENHNLTEIHEVLNIRWADKNGNVEAEENGVYGPLDADTPVSMNFWGLMPKAIELLGDIFKEELPHGIETNPIKYEALLPNHIGYMVRDKKANVKVLRSEDSWMGVTYKEDKPIVQEKINALKDSGAYPFDLWKK